MSIIRGTQSSIFFKLYVIRINTPLRLNLSFYGLMFQVISIVLFKMFSAFKNKIDSRQPVLSLKCNGFATYLKFGNNLFGHLGIVLLVAVARTVAHVGHPSGGGHLPSLPEVVAGRHAAHAAHSAHGR